MQATPEQPQCWASFDCSGTLIDWETGMRHALEGVIPGNAERFAQGLLSGPMRREHF